jgi:hypothetical protein
LNSSLKRIWFFFKVKILHSHEEWFWQKCKSLFRPDFAKLESPLIAFSFYPFVCVPVLTIFYVNLFCLLVCFFKCFFPFQLKCVVEKSSVVHCRALVQCPFPSVTLKFPPPFLFFFWETLLDTSFHSFSIYANYLLLVSKPARKKNIIYHP